jgi:hypothetical protein
MQVSGLIFFFKKKKYIYIYSHHLVKASMTWEIPATFCRLLPVFRNLNYLGDSNDMLTLSNIMLIIIGY